jgi:hypothetical protein
VQGRKAYQLSYIFPARKRAQEEDQQMTTNQNGIDVPALQQFVQDVASDVSKRAARFNVKTKWQHQTRSVLDTSRQIRGTDAAILADHSHIRQALHH